MVICTRLFCFPPFPQFKMNLARNWDLDTEEELCRTEPTTQRAAKYPQPLTAFAPHSIIPCNSTQILFLAPFFQSFFVHPEFHCPVPSPGVGLCYSFNNSSPSDTPIKFIQGQVKQQYLLLKLGKRGAASFFGKKKFFKHPQNQGGILGSNSDGVSQIEHQLLHHACAAP